MVLIVGRRKPLDMFLRLAIMVALLGTTLVMRATTEAGADSPSPTDPLYVAPAVDSNPDPDVFETTIVAQTATRDLGRGLVANVWTYNGTTPGPQLRLKVGDTVIVHFRNELPLPSGIHWHGIELANTSDGTQLTQNPVPTGESFLYKFTVPRPGLFWYHPHHAATNPVFKNQFGSLIVADPHDDTLVAKGVLPPREHTRTLFVSDTTVCKDPGQNDTDTYDDSMPWAGGGPLPEQPGPFPSDLCDRPMDDNGAPIRDANGRPIPLRKGDIPNIQKAVAPIPVSGGRTNEGQTVLANGRNWGARAGSPEAPGAVQDGATMLDVQAGQGLRLQAANASTIRFARLRLTDSAGKQIPLIRVGGEGGLLDSARIEGGYVGGVPDTEPAQFNTKYNRGEIVMDPSDRADLVVAIPPDAAPGPATLWTLDYARTGDFYANIPTVPVLHLNVTGQSAEAYTIAEGTPLRTDPAVNDPVEALGPAYLFGLPDTTGTIKPLLNPAAFSPPKPGTAKTDIRLVANGIHPTIDTVPGTHGKHGDYTKEPHTASTRYARLGDTLELTVTNSTPAHHTFHLHGFSFQPIAFERNPLILVLGGNYAFDYREFVDSFDIPPGYVFRFRVRLDDRPLMDGVTPGGGLGRWVFHCHIFFHHQLGMHAELVVLAPDGNEKPNVNADTTSVSVPQGDTASATGTYFDTDGDPVALQASEGTVTDLGNGRWAWSGSAAGAAGKRMVYITATDADGLQDQVPFELVVGNVPPIVTVIDPPEGSAFPAGSTVMVTAAISDPGGDDPLACRFDWDDGLGAGTSVPATSGTCSQSMTISQAGVYTVAVTGSDGAGETGSDTTSFAVFDPAAGGVTGKGTIVSPTGAFPSNPAATGVASFDFDAAYVTGQSVPSGKAKFGVTLPQFDFRATGYRWLVAAGARAQASGTGKVNGVGGHTFLLTVVDGAASGSDGTDRFRLKVRDITGAVVYDNVPGAPDDIDQAAPQPIATGNVVRT